MAQKKKSGNTVAAVAKLCEPFAQQLGLTIWDIRYVKEGSYWYLRIFIDKPEGVTLDDCEAMSRAINDPLDQLDPIDGEYCLEVCSPGIDRELVRPEHFEAFLGYENSVPTFETEEGEFLDIDKKDTSSVRVCDDYVDIDDEDFEEEF